jgi:hypothetical protein
MSSPGRFFLVCLSVAAATSAAHARDDAVVIDLAEVDVFALESMKRMPGARWWLEVGEVLLLAGDAERIQQQIPGRRVIEKLPSLAPAELALHARGCGDSTTAIDDSLILLNLGSYDLVRRPQSFSPLGEIDLRASTQTLGAPEWLPVEANSTLARLHRFDRPEGALAADERVATIVDRVDATRWFASVETLASWDRSSFSMELGMARQWLVEQFGALGLAISEPAFSFIYQGHQANVANVIGRFTGVLHPDEWIVVGGHYDSRQQDNLNPANSPGADDNASGCAGVVEAAHAIVEYLPQRSVLFMCYAGEEQGLYGSNAHVDALQGAGDLSKIVAMLNMDMIGWSPDATLGVIAETRPGKPNVELAQLLADSALTYAPALSADHVVIAENSCCSDHMPYINAGRPGVLSIHRLRAGTPYYHSTSDTPQNLGAHAQDIGGAIVRMNVAALVQLAGTDRIFRSDHEEG